MRWRPGVRVRQTLGMLLHGSDTSSENAYRTDWEAELSYWHRRFEQTLQERFHLEMHPIQLDVSTSPSVDLVETIQDEHKADPKIFLAGGLRTVHAHLLEMSDHGFDVLRFSRVLEIGVGLGRLIRHYSPFPAELHGCDVTGPVVDFVSRALGSVITATKNEPRPPLPYDDDTFDLVYANSVFTHIRLAETAEWVQEISRVVAPRGCVIISVFNPDVHLAHLAPREFDRLVTRSGCLEWGRDDTVRENYVYMTQPTLFETWGSSFEILELRRFFKEQDHLILRHPG